MMDNSDYIEKEKELKRERKFLRNIMATIPDSLLILDSELQIKSANHSFYKLFQTKPGMTIGRKIADILGDEDGKLNTKLGGLFGAKDTLENFELHHQSAKLGERILNITARGIIVAEEEEEEEEEEEVLVVIDDVTERRRAEEMLRRTEENFRRSLDDSPLGIRIVDAEGELLYANQAMLDIYGYASIKELKTTSTKKRYTPESYAEHQERKKKRRLGKSVPSNYEISIVRKDGEVRYLEVFRKEVLWNSGTQFQVLYHDVTERKQAEEALRESEARYRTLVETALEGISTADQEETITFANRAFAEMLGYKPEELVGKNLRMLVSDEDWLKTCSETEKRRRGESSRYGVTLLGKGTIAKSVIISAAPFCASDGRFLGSLGVIMDITERKRSEEALRESRSFFSGTLNNLLTFIGVLEPNGKVIFVNNTPLEATGIELKDVIGKIFYDTYWWAYSEEARQTIKKDIEGCSSGESLVHDIEAQMAGGSLMWVEYSMHPIYGKEGEIEYLVAEGRDITERKKAEEALQQSEDKYRSLVDNVKLGVFRSTPGSTGRFLEVNKAMQEITGYSREELLRMDVSSLYVHPEERRAVTEEIASAQGKMTRELNFRKKDGNQIVVRDIKAPVRDGTGKILYFDGVLEDVTEHRQAEEALQQSEEKLRLMFQSVAEGIAVVDLNGVIIEVNQNMLDMHGLPSRDKMVGKPALEFITPHDHKKLQLSMQNTLEQGMVEKIELNAIKSDGSTFIAEVSAGVLKDTAGHLVGSIATMHDITEQKRAEERLRQTLAEWATTFDSIADLVSIHDKEFRLLKVNRTFADFFKTEPEKLIGRTCYEVVHGTSEPWPSCPYRQTLETSKPAKAEGFDARLQMHLEMTTSPIFDEAGEVTSTVHICRDVTERKKMQEQLMAQDRLSSIGQLVSGVAHEINNPLTGVIGFSELLLKRDLPDDVKADLKIVNDEAMRTARIIKSLLAFARKQPEGKTPVDIKEQIQRVMDLRDHEQKVNNIQVITRFASDLPWVMGNASQLQQVFFNIVINAEFFMLEAHQKGNLTITTERIGDFVRASFADDGPGISQENMRNLFTPFFTTKEVGKGTGLGLSIGYGIITEHGGRIYAESTPKKGATFIVELPIKEETTSQEVAR